MEKEVELKVITLEDNQDYAIIDEIEGYLYLANVNDQNDICIRKDIGEEIIGLENEEEFYKALNLFNLKKRS